MRIEKIKYKFDCISNKLYLYKPTYNTFTHINIHITLYSLNINLVYKSGCKYRYIYYLTGMESLILSYFLYYLKFESFTILPRHIRYSEADSNSLLVLLQF